MTKAIIVIAWLLMSVAIIVITTLPVSLQTHLVAAFLCMGLLAILKFFKAEGNWRLIGLGFGTAVVLRYVYWRTTSTLPPIGQLENFIPGFVLYLAEMYSVAMLALSLFIVSMPLPANRPRPGSADYAPTVDVFVPTYNEDPEMLANTLAAAKNMDYPADKLTVWLLDDGGTLQKRNAASIPDSKAAQRRHEELQVLCASLGANYLTRDRNEHAKAGNMNNALKQSHGDLITVFDADHAPARDFLRETVGYFEEDPRLFLVQTPHFFLNPDPIERNLKTFNTMPSENEMFYGIIQRGLDKWNAAFFCGSAAVLNRRALVESNGFSGLSITEDCETALALHSRGWNSVYVDKPLIAGLQPATFTSFIGQRSRWAQGMMQILMFRMPLFKRGLSMPQRLCYMSSTLFWLFPFPRLVFLVAPLFYLFFDLEIFAREPLDAELSLWPLPLALDFGTVRICPDDPPAARRGLRHSSSDQANLQGDGEGRIDQRQQAFGDQPSLLHHLRHPADRHHRLGLQDLRRTLQIRRNAGGGGLELPQPHLCRLRARRRVGT
jgi:cellulose synthase (UDP-forming)